MVIDQWLADLLANVPLAVGMLIVLWAMFNRWSQSEDSRESNRAADEAARNEQMTRILDLQANMQTTVQSLNNILAAIRDVIERHDAAAAGASKHLDERLDEIEAVAVTARNASGQTLEIVKPLPGKSDSTLSAVQALAGRLDAIDGRLAEISDSVRGIAEGWTAQGKMNSAIQGELRDMEQVRRSMQEALQDIRGDIRDLLARAGETA